MSLPRYLLQPIVKFTLEDSSFDCLPPEVAAVAKEMLVNAAAAGLAGAAQPDSLILTRYMQEMHGSGQCTIIGQGLRSSPVYAALVNGLMINLLDFDDTVVATGCHPGSAVFPAVMALGELHGRSGRDVLAAFVLGCEVTSWLSGWRHGFADTGRLNPPQPWPAIGAAHAVGAAAAAGSLLRLDASRLEQALQLAARAGDAGSLAGPGRAYAQGHAAMSGLMAAMLAGQGMTAAPQRPGLFPGEGTPAEPRPAARAAVNQSGLGRPYDIIRPGVSLRLYPCAAQAHTAIEAALQLTQQYRISAGDATSVQVSVTPAALAALPYPTPGDGWEARSCLSYLVATALTHGHPLLDSFTDSATGDAAVRHLMEQVAIEATAAGSPAIPFPAAIAVTLRDGRTLRQRVEFARGLAELPLAPEELDAKFLYCSRYILPPDHIEEALTRLRDLENIENTAGLFSVLGG